MAYLPCQVGQACSAGLHLPGLHDTLKSAMLPLITRQGWPINIFRELSLPALIAPARAGSILMSAPPNILVAGSDSLERPHAQLHAAAS